MNVKFHSVGFTTDVKLEEFIQKKLNKLDVIHDKITSADVYLKLDSHDHVKDKVVEIKVHIPRKDCFVKSTSKTSLQSRYNCFPKLFYIKFSNIYDSNDCNSKFIIHKYKSGITFGTFDLFHYGHDNILKQCMQFCEYLRLGLSSDELNEKKGKNSVHKYEKRKKIIEEADEKYADVIFKEESLEEKNNYVTQMGAEILMMGDDWAGKFDWVSCDVLYMERTPNISTTMLKEQLKIVNNN